MTEAQIDTPHTYTSERAVIDRLHRLRVILPAMAQELAVARREAARLRRENAELAGRLTRLDGAGTCSHSKTTALQDHAGRAQRNDGDGFAARPKSVVPLI